MTDLSIIIVNWNTKDLLENCLRSVYENTDGLNLEIFVVDNASTDGSRQMVKEKFPDVNLIENKENLGFAKANNQAIKLANGKYVLLLNSDTVVLPNSLNKMIEFMDEHPGVGATGCKLLNSDNTIQPSFAPFPTIASELFLPVALKFKLYSWYARKIKKPTAVDWVGGACLMIRLETINQVGLMDERFFFYGEETDWCYRMKKFGWKVYYLPREQIIHIGGGSIKQATEQILLNLYESKIYFFKKHYGIFLSTLLKLLILKITVFKIITWSIVNFLTFGKQKLPKSKISLNLMILKSILI